MQPSTPSTTQFLSIASLSLLDSLAFLLIGLRLSWLGAPVAWCWEQAGPHGPSLHLVFLKVLSWLPYYIYSTLLILVISLSSHGVLNQLYADDTQAYLHCPSTAAMGAAHIMHRAMGALADWMSSNRLRLNAQKTKFIWLGTRQQLAKLNLDALSAEFPTMSFSQVV